jgi:DNA-binding MarR family transcriptional regulator
VSNATKAVPARTFYDGSHYVVGDSVGYLLHQLVSAMRRRIEQDMAAHDLTAAQWVPLWQLKLGRASTAQELARGMDIDAGAMTRLIDRLAAKGLVERVRLSTDRRVVTLKLTAVGEAVAEQVPQVLAEVNNAYLQGFSARDWATLKRLLRQMLANGQAAASAGEASA